MHVELARQVIGLEYEALALAAGPLTTLAVGWLARQVTTHLRDQRAVGYTTRLVAWAAQAIPDKSARYGEVAGLLSRRFPMLSGEQIEVLIESEVLGLKTALRTAAPAQAMPIPPAPTQGAMPAVTNTTQAAPIQGVSTQAVSPQSSLALPGPLQDTPVPAAGSGAAGLRVGAG